MVDVRAIGLVAADEALLRHDLQQLERGRVGRRPLAHQDVVHLADGAGAELPEHAQDRELGVGGARCLGHMASWTKSTNIFVNVNEDLRRLPAETRACPDGSGERTGETPQPGTGRRDISGASGSTRPPATSAKDQALHLRRQVHAFLLAIILG